MKQSRGACVTLLLLGFLCFGGCVRYAGPSVAVDPSTITGEGWLRVTPVTEVRQNTDGECGSAATSMVLSRWAEIGLEAMSPDTGTWQRASDLRDRLRSAGLQAFVIEGTFEDLQHEIAANRPVIVGTIKRLSDKRGLSHYEVVVALHPERKLVVTIDPALGWRQSSYAGFEEEWAGSDHTTIVAMPPLDTPP